MSDQSDSRQVFPNIPEDTPQSLSILGTMRRWLGNYYPYPVRLAKYLLARQSLRVGSGTGLSAFDGQDGRVVANGALASLIFGNNAAPNTASYGSWFDDGTHLNLGTESNAQLVSFAKATGLVGQPAYTTIAPGASVAQAASVATNGTRIITPIGDLDARFNITTSAIIGAGSVLGTITAAHRISSGFHFWGARRVSGGVVSTTTLSVNSSGQIASDVALANGDSVYSHDRYFLF